MLKPLLLHLALVVVLILYIFSFINIWIFIIIIHIYIAAMVYGSAYIGSGFYLPAQLKLNSQEKNIALSFDDGIHPETTPKVLDILQKYGVKAAFFIIGKNIESTENQAILRRMYAEGHQIGNHSYSHSPFFDFYPKKRVEAELRQTHALIKNTIGTDIQWFRPPYGVTNPPIAGAVKALGYKTIGWSLRSLDTVIKEPKPLLERVLAKLKAGDIVLLHDHHAHIVEFLPQFLEAVLAQGYHLKPIS